MKERRKYPRVQHEMKVEVFRDEDCRDLRARACTITDISRNSLSFVSSDKISEGEKLFLRFKIPGELMVSLCGKILWRRWEHSMYFYGFQYLSLDWFSRHNLEQRFLAQFFNIPRSKREIVLEYGLLILAVFAMAQILKRMSLEFSFVILLCFLGVLYFVLATKFRSS